MEILVELFQKRLAQTSPNFVRSLFHEINWDARLIGIKGARGVGKTTLMLQYIKKILPDKLDETLYVSLDTFWFNDHRLYSLAEDFVKQGGVYLFLDEVHRYENWSQELKNIYDDFPELKVVFTGSSLLEILNARADLSRRAVVYNMQGFSFREYLSIETGIELEVLSLEQILGQHSTLSQNINEQVKIFKYFDNYLKSGYYPFYMEQPELYPMRLSEVVNMILEIELPLLRQIEMAYVRKIKQLLSVIASAVPFKPNVSKISQKIGVNRATLLHYLHYLDEVALSINLYKDTQGISQLQKPDKIFLENTNLMYLLGNQNPNKGSLRETFFANQLGYKHHIEYAEQGDFLVDKKYVFEVGGKNKSKAQIENINQAYIAADEILYGYKNKIPLWLFGFLY